MAKLFAINKLLSNRYNNAPGPNNERNANDYYNYILVVKY